MREVMSYMPETRSVIASCRTQPRKKIYASLEGGGGVAILHQSSDGQWAFYSLGFAVCKYPKDYKFYLSASAAIFANKTRCFEFNTLEEFLVWALDIVEDYYEHDETGSKIKARDDATAEVLAENEAAENSMKHCRKTTGIYEAESLERSKQRAIRKAKILLKTNGPVAAARTGATASYM